MILKSPSTDIEYACELDEKDELATFRNEFVITDPDMIYLDGNSLGRLPKRTIGRMQSAIANEWGDRLIRIWNDGWIRTPTDLGKKIASLIGAQADEVIVTESTSTNLFKLALSALRFDATRCKIVSDEFNFPSDLYVLQGIIDLLGNNHKLELVRSNDGITIDIDQIRNAIDEQTALVSLSHVAYKSAFMYDMAEVTDIAHEHGAMILWDLSHSVGAVPVDLGGSRADLAVGCTYKYLNGGPGSPAFLYVRKDLQRQLSPVICGWFSSNKPFSFELGYTPADDISRFCVGTPPMLSMMAVEPAVDLILDAGVERLRNKSVLQTAYFIYLVQQWLIPIGFEIGSPLDASIRGSHVSLRHPEAYRINRAMIESLPPAVKVIPDYRTPDYLRLGIAPIYTTFEEIYLATKRIKQIVDDSTYLQYSLDMLPVT